MMSLMEIKCFLLTSVVGVCGLLLIRWFYNFWKSKELFHSLKNKRVIITGGSSGIGLSLAKLAYRYGAHVTIMARNVTNLKRAEEEIKSQIISAGEIRYLSIDLTANYQSLEDQLMSLKDQTDILINCAGGAISRTFAEMKPEDIEAQIKLNYLGAAHITKVLLPGMLAKKSPSHIVFVSSVAGQVGIYGLAAYSAGKFALRGLAECLQMEVSHRNISVTLAFPPDTQTPGFDNEQIGKPLITKKLSAAGGLVMPDDVAKSILRSTLKKEFFCSIGLDGWLVTQLTYGMCLPQSVVDLFCLIFFCPITTIISIGYGIWMRYVVHTNS